MDAIPAGRGAVSLVADGVDVGLVVVVVPHPAAASVVSSLHHCRERGLGHEFRYVRSAPSVASSLLLLLLLADAVLLPFLCDVVRLFGKQPPDHRGRGSAPELAFLRLGLSADHKTAHAGFAADEKAVGIGTPEGFSHRQAGKAMDVHCRCRRCRCCLQETFRSGSRNK